MDCLELESMMYMMYITYDYFKKQKVQKPMMCDMWKVCVLIA